MDKILAKRMSRLHIYEAISDTDYETEDELSESDDVLSQSNSPPLDDTKGENDLVKIGIQFGVLFCFSVLHRSN